MVGTHHRGERRLVHGSRRPGDTQCEQVRDERLTVGLGAREGAHVGAHQIGADGAWAEAPGNEPSVDASVEGRTLVVQVVAAPGRVPHEILDVPEEGLAAVVKDRQSERAQRGGGGGEEQEVAGHASDRLGRVLVHEVGSVAAVGARCREHGGDVGGHACVRIDRTLVARDPRDEVAQRRAGVAASPAREGLVGAEVGVHRGAEARAALEIGAEHGDLRIDRGPVAQLVGLVGRPPFLVDAQRHSLGGDDDFDLAGGLRGGEERRDGVADLALVALPRHGLVRPGREGGVGQRDRQVDHVARRNPARLAVVLSDGP